MNTGFFNSNGSVNTGPFSPVWADGDVIRCVGDACSAAGGGFSAVTIFLVVGGFVAFVMLMLGIDAAR